MKAPWLALLLAAVLTACATAAPAPPTSTLDLTLRPLAPAGEVTAIAVRYTVADGAVPPGQVLTLTAPIVQDMVEGVADRMTGITVTDADGPVPLTITDDPPLPGGATYHRHWRAGRPVRFPLTVAYAALVQPAGSKSGPPLGIRPSAGGVSGAGSTFLLLPTNAGVQHSRLHWDLTGLAPASLAATSFGDGDFDLAGPPAQLLKGWYMAGPAGRYPATGDAGGFSATWLGRPPWDVEATMAWSARVHADLAGFFRTAPPRYRVFVRVLETPPFGGGTEMTNSFMFSRGPLKPGETVEVPRRTLVHEMIHGFVGEIDGPGWEQAWFMEGLTSHYTSQLQLRFGDITPDAYLAEINQAAEDYYTSPARNWSAARIAGVGFGDAQIRRLPYRRGQLYFAALDAEIRARSHGRRDLDVVMREIFARRATGWRFDNAAWRRIVEREAGPGAAARFEALVLRGTATLVPPPGMLGPCFAAEAARYEAGGTVVEGYRWVRAGVPAPHCASS